MLFRVLFLFLVLAVFWGPVHGGPMTNPHPNMSDQELFWGADQYDFAVVLRAAGMECFWHFAHRGERFYLNFMIQWVTGVGQDRHLSVTVNAPSGLIVSSVDDAKGQINFEAEESGFYQMCFSNFHNRFGTMQVFLSFGVYYDGLQDPGKSKEEDKKKKEEVSKDLNNTLNVIEEASHRVENYVFHMFRYYNFGRMRRSIDHYLLLSNSQYITWWSTALSLLIVTSGYLQLLFLKRLFITKTCTEDEKPRILQGRPRTHWRVYISHLAWERLGIPQEELESVVMERDIWNSLLSLLPPQPNPGYVEENGWMDILAIMSEVDLVGLGISIADMVLSMCKTIYKMAQNVKANKERCQQVAERVRVLEDLVLTIKPGQISPSVYKALNELYTTLESAKMLLMKFSQTKAFVGFMKSSSLKDKFYQVDKKLTDNLHVLSGALLIDQVLHKVYKTVKGQKQPASRSSTPTPVPSIMSPMQMYSPTILTPVPCIMPSMPMYPSRTTMSFPTFMTAMPLPGAMAPIIMLLKTLLIVLLSSQCVWTRKSEPSFDEADAGLFRGSDKYDFAVEVPAAGMECFWHFAHQSGSFFLMYMVQWVTGMANDHRLFVTINSPQGVLMASKNEGVGQMNFQTEVTGFYRICLGNHNNQFGGIRVFLNFGVIYKGLEESSSEKGEEEKVLNSTLAGIEENVQKLQNQIFHIWRHYNFARMRKGKDHYLLLSNLNYITWWSATQSFVILLSGYLQLHVLKRLFRTDSSRPQC
ncbi:uncharacterized protein tmed6 [Symphorus nematophorus]